MASSQIIIFTSISFWIDHSMSASLLRWIGLYFLLFIASSTSASVSIGGFIYNMVSFFHSSSIQVHPNAEEVKDIIDKTFGSTYMAYDSNNTLYVVYAWCVRFSSTCINLYIKKSFTCVPFLSSCAFTTTYGSSSRTNPKLRTTGFKYMASWRPRGKMRVFPETRAWYKGNPSCSTACCIRSLMREAL